MKLLNVIALTILSTLALAENGLASQHKTLTFETATATEVALVLCGRNDLSSAKASLCFNRYKGWIKHTNGNQKKTKFGLRRYILATTKLSPTIVDKQTFEMLNEPSCNSSKEICN